MNGKIWRLIRGTALVVLFVTLLLDGIAHAVTFSFSENTSEIQSPERGVYEAYFPELAGWGSEATNLAARYAAGETLVMFRIDLDPAYTTTDDLPASVTTTINSRCAEAREAGVKLIPRFRYNNTSNDATKTRQLSHIDEIFDALDANSDVIAFAEAGFIGNWGEWHSSENINIAYSQTAGDANAQEFGQHLLDGIGTDRMIAFRYPKHMRNITDTNNPGHSATSYVTAAASYGGSRTSRVAHHNDCIGYDSRDRGTYLEFDEAADRSYLDAQSNYTFTTGEPCAWAGYPTPNAWIQCSAVKAQFRKNNWLSLRHGGRFGGGGGDDSIAYWQSAGCWTDMRKRMGYRLRLGQAVLPASVDKGAAMAVNFTIANEGYGVSPNPRTTYVCFEKQTAAERACVAMAVDWRRWVSQLDTNGNVKATPTYSTVNENVVVPPGLSNGDYDVAIWMPDAASTLRATSNGGSLSTIAKEYKYTVKFANQLGCLAADAPCDTGDASDFPVPNTTEGFMKIGEVEVTDGTPDCTTNADCDESPSDNPCTTDTCSSGSCVITNNSASCNDGLFCTATDTCANGICGGSGTPCGGSTPTCNETTNACESSGTINESRVDQWHKLEIHYTDVDADTGTGGNQTYSESTNTPNNPALDRRLVGLFRSPADVYTSFNECPGNPSGYTSGQCIYKVEGFWNSDLAGGTSGNKFTMRFSPPTIGDWTYTAKFCKGNDARILNSSDCTGATDATTALTEADCADGTCNGTFTVEESTATGRDYRATEKGWLTNDRRLNNLEGSHYYSWAGSYPADPKFFVPLENGIGEGFLGYVGITGTAQSSTPNKLCATFNSSCEATDVPWDCCTGLDTGTCGSGTGGGILVPVKDYGIHEQHYVDNDNCTAADTPWDCCTGSGTGTCVDDPTWATTNALCDGTPCVQADAGRGIIGAVNYIADPFPTDSTLQGANSQYVVLFNSGPDSGGQDGDTRDTCPYVDCDGAGENQKHFHQKKLSEWEIVFSHGQTVGLGWHLLFSESELDDDMQDSAKTCTTGSSGACIGTVRKLYLKEMIARFGHHPMIRWNLGEENGFTQHALSDMLIEVKRTDYADHPVGIHTDTLENSVENADDIYEDTREGIELRGRSELDTCSIQWGPVPGSYDPYFEAFGPASSLGVRPGWRPLSDNAGKRWVVAMDESQDCRYETTGDTTAQSRDLCREGVFYPLLLQGWGGWSWYWQTADGDRCLGGSEQGDVCTVDGDCDGGGTCADTEHNIDSCVNNFTPAGITAGLQWMGIADRLLNDGTSDISTLTWSNTEHFVDDTNSNVYQGARLSGTDAEVVAYQPDNDVLRLKGLPAGTYSIIWTDATNGDSCVDNQSPLTFTGGNISIGICQCCSNDTLLKVDMIEPTTPTTIKPNETTTTSTTSTTIVDPDPEPVLGWRCLGPCVPAE